MKLSKETLNTPLFDVKSDKVTLELANMPYKEYLQTIYWDAVKKKMHETIGYKCEMCGLEENIHVHHFHYANRGKETLNDLACLCEDCHYVIHATNDPMVINIHNRHEFVKQIKLSNKIKKKFNNKKYLKVIPLAQRAVWTMPQLELLLEYNSEDILKMFEEEIKNGLIVKSTGICGNTNFEFYLVNRFVWHLIELDFPKVGE